MYTAEHIASVEFLRGGRWASALSDRVFCCFYGKEEPDVTTMAIVPNQPFQQFMRGLVDLLRASNSDTRGQASFEVGDDGDWQHAYTVLTVKLRKGESLEAFHARIRAEYKLQKGDMIDILDNGGRLDTARIKLLPRA